MILVTLTTGPDGRAIVTRNDIMADMAIQASDVHPLEDAMEGTGHEVANPAADLVRSIVTQAADTLVKLDAL